MKIVDRIRRRVKSHPGATCREIAHKLGVPYSVVDAACRYHQFPVRRVKKKPSAGFLRQAKRLWEAGFTFDEVGRRLEVSRNVIAGLRWRHDWQRHD